MFQAIAFFIYPDSGSGSDPDFIDPLFGLPLTIFAMALSSQVIHVKLWHNDP